MKPFKIILTAGSAALALGVGVASAQKPATDQSQPAVAPAPHHLKQSAPPPTTDEMNKHLAAHIGGGSPPEPHPNTGAGSEGKPQN